PGRGYHSPCGMPAASFRSPVRSLSESFRGLIFYQPRDLAKDSVALAIAIDPMQDRQLLVESSQRFRLRAELLQTRLQHAQIIVVTALQTSVAIGTYWTIGKLRAR